MGDDRRTLPPLLHRPELRGLLLDGAHHAPAPVAARQGGPPADPGEGGAQHLDGLRRLPGRADRPLPGHPAGALRARHLHQGAQDRPLPERVDPRQPQRLPERPGGSLVFPADVDPLFRMAGPPHLRRRRPHHRPLRSQPPAPGGRRRAGRTHLLHPQRHLTGAPVAPARAAARQPAAGAVPDRPGGADQGHQDLHPRHAPGGEPDARSRRLDRRPRGRRPRLRRGMPQPHREPRPHRQG